MSNQQHVTKRVQFTMKGVKGNEDIKPLENQTYMRMVTNVVFTQVARYSQTSVKTGIKMFGEIAIAAMFKESKQSNEGAVQGNHKPVGGPQDASELSSEDKRKALESVNLIKEKSTGTIKGRTCANKST